MYLYVSYVIDGVHSSEQSQNETKSAEVVEWYIHTEKLLYYSRAARTCEMQAGNVFKNFLCALQKCTLL